MAVNQTPPGSRVQAADAVASAHARLLANSAWQFEAAEAPVRKTPEWVVVLDRLLRAAEPALPYIFWAAAAVLALVAVYAAVRMFFGEQTRGAGASGPRLDADPAWRPQEGDARDLLALADALAKEARFAEAAHLLLLRSVEDIRQRRPAAIKVSATAREISQSPIVPGQARLAFGQIVSVVERSLFGGCPVTKREYVACREAYAAFALGEGWS